MKTLLAIINIVLLLCTLAWPITSYASVLLFGPLKSYEHSAAFMFAVALLAYPVPAVLGNILFWVRRKKGSINELLFFTLMSSLGYLYIGGAIYLFVFS